MADKRVLIFISDVQKALEHEWFVNEAVNTSVKFEFVLFNSADSELFRYIKGKGFKCDNYSLRSKFLIPFYVFFFWVKLLFKHYDSVHCHLLEASLIGIIASKMAGVRKRIYTRHHSDFHHVYFPHAVKYDDLINRYATHIIAVSDGVKQILVEKEKVEAKKIQVIPHGIPAAVMSKKVDPNEVKLMKEKFELNSNAPIIGVVSRFTEWKGVQYIIPAFKAFQSKRPNAKLVLVNAKGEFASNIQELLKDLPPKSFITITFENNMPALFSAFDMFVHVPINRSCEAFGQVYIEAMCYGVPMICTLSGVANSMVVNEHNALVVDHKNSSEIETCLERLASDSVLKEKLIANARVTVQEYTFERKMKTLMNIYLQQ